MIKLGYSYIKTIGVRNISLGRVPWPMQKRFSLTCKSVSNAVCQNCISSSPPCYILFRSCIPNNGYTRTKVKLAKICIQRSRNTCEKSSFMSQAVYSVPFFSFFVVAKVGNTELEITRVFDIG